MADIRGDLIFDGFEPMTAVLGHHDEHDLDLSSGRIQEIVPVTALALELERTASSEDGKLNLATEAADSATLEPHTDPTSGWLVSPEPRTRLRLWDPDRVHPRPSNLIGRRSWSSAPRTSFSTRLLATC